MPMVAMTPNVLKTRCEKLTQHKDMPVVSKCVFVASIRKSIHCGLAEAVARKNKKSFHKTLGKMSHKFNGTDFNIEKIQCHNECQSLFDLVKDEMGIEMEFEALGDHESVSKQSH